MSISFPVPPRGRRLSVGKPGPEGWRSERWTRRLERWFEQPIALVFTVGGAAVLTAVAWHGAAASVRRDAEAVFDRDVRQITQTLASQLALAEIQLRTAAAYVRSSEQVVEREWQDFVATLGVSDSPATELILVGADPAAPSVSPRWHYFADDSEVAAEWGTAALWPEAGDTVRRAAVTGKVEVSRRPQGEARPRLAVIAVRDPEGAADTGAPSAYVVAPFHLEPLIDAFRQLAAPGLHVALRLEDGSQVPDMTPVIAPAAAAGALTAVERVRFGGQEWELRFFVGPEFATNLSATPPRIVLAGGTAFTLLMLLPYVAVARSRRRAEQWAEDMTLGLREARDRLQLILDRVPEGVAVVDRDGGLQEMSRSGLAMLGCDQMKEACGRSLSEWLRAEDQPLLQAALAQARQGQPASCLVRTDTARGSERWLEAAVVPLQSVGGQVMSILVVCRDQTEAREAEERLRRSERGLLQAQRLGQIGNWGYLPESATFEASAEFRRIFQLPTQGPVALADVLGRLSPADRQRVEELRRQPAASWADFRGEFRLVLPDGAERVVAAQVEALEPATACAPRLAGVVQDVTEQKRAEQKRLALFASLQQAQKMETIGLLAGGVAHDFNNILAGILCYLTLLKQDLADQPKAHEFVSEIERASLRARDLVRQILTFSRRPSGESREPIVLRPAVEDVVRLLRATLCKRVDLRVDLRCSGARVWLEPVQVHQVLLNLVTNAADAMQQQGQIDIAADLVERPARAAGRPERPGARTYVRLRVADQGPGLPRELVDRIFEPFFTTKPAGRGTGLGLPVVQGIVQDHGGWITVASEPGRGAVFEIHLPVAEGEGGAARGVCATSASGAGQHILLVEDEVSLIRAQQQILERFGYRVSGFTSSRQAWRRFAEEPGLYDVVITDNSMPEMSGLELSREIRRVKPDLPILITTGYTTTEAEDNLRALRIQRVMYKPVPAEVLATAVARALQGEPVRRGSAREMSRGGA